ncbi:hypothetical protein DTL21_19710 [Bremerella cremea]|uniref:Tetratricopeptide repeat protein n=1 Tax=Blastopirellula marina TaxID=124 RepID=A0A2S8FKI9_9BACT|nr:MULTISPECIES: hypothetical protein [Pirellulaceae]PQO32444.1 hypothetical protein C5Y83_19690 [Blastopirellula marina]RCS45511.1 hypothetical protein DTL21_19710 [Bremerella cremea]
MSPPFKPTVAGSWLLRSLTFCLSIWLIGTASTALADRLILRDLTLIQDVTVIGFDEEGVKVTDNNLIPWYEIELGTVSPDKQTDFDRLRDELGIPLFRIHQRLKVGDYAGAREPAEQVFSRYKDRESNVALMVCLATMWGRLAEGDRASAVEAYFCALRILRSNRAEVSKLPGSRRPDFDKSTGLTGDLLPLFFDKQKAATALPQATAAAKQLGSGTPDGVFVYLGSLAIAAEQFPEGEAWEKKIRSGNLVVKEWHDLLSAYALIQKGNLQEAHDLLEPNINALQRWNQPVAWYLLGVSGTRSKEFVAIENGILDLLHLPAVYGHEHPELSAAALAETDTALQRIQQSDRVTGVRHQLLFFYGGTLHAEQLRTKLNSSSTP